MPLNSKQIKFCEEYLLDLNATQAAIRAGYSEKTARVTGAENLTKPDIRAYIEQKQKELSEKTLVDAEFVILGLKEVANRSLVRVPVMVWDPQAKQMTQRQEMQDNGSFADVWTFDSSGANRAFELLGKHIGLFEKDNNQKKPDPVILNFVKPVDAPKGH